MSDPPRVLDWEIAALGEYAKQIIGWLGPCQDPREYAYELGLQFSQQPLTASRDGSELVGNLILYRWDPDSRIWGARVFGGIARWLLRDGVRPHARADRLRLIGELALGDELTRRTIEHVVQDQIYCPKWLLRAHAKYICGAQRLPPRTAA